MNKNTTLWVRKTTHKDLQARCIKGQTYDQLINNLMTGPFTEDEIGLIFSALDGPLQSEEVELVQNVAINIERKLKVLLRFVRQRYGED